MATNPQIRSNNSSCSTSSEMQHEMNTALYDHNIPSQFLQPYLDVRPVSTKYSIMPIVDPRAQPTVKLEKAPTYNPESVFNPGNTQSPWSGFASAINTESELRNQIYALQKCSQATYIPKSTSDLYSNSFQPTKSNNNVQQFPGLFSHERFDHFNPNPENIGNNLFNNSTRVQIRNLTKDCTKPSSHKK